MSKTHTSLERLQKVPVVTYPQLRSAIRHAISSGKLRAQKAVSREKVRTAWETGQFIVSHLFHHQKRADYGAKVIERLSRDLKLSLTELRYSVEFARAYPILRDPGELTWSHYQVLLSVNDSKLRDSWAGRTRENGWNHKVLGRKIRSSRVKDQARSESRLSETEKLAVPRLGKPGFYQFKTPQKGLLKGKRVVDLGFSNYYKPTAAIKKKIKVGKGDELFTYQVSGTDVVDGDTFWAWIDLGFGMFTYQKLRFKHINSPEIYSKAGLQAKKYLERALKKGKILIKTTKSDKYDRYLADVFVGKRYLNAELLEKGLATVFRPN